MPKFECKRFLIEFDFRVVFPYTRFHTGNSLGANGKWLFYYTQILIAVLHMRICVTFSHNKCLKWYDIVNKLRINRYFHTYRCIYPWHFSIVIFYYFLSLHALKINIYNLLLFKYIVWRHARQIVITQICITINLCKFVL